VTKGGIGNYILDQNRTLFRYYIFR